MRIESIPLFHFDDSSGFRYLALYLAIKSLPSRYKNDPRYKTALSFMRDIVLYEAFSGEFGNAFKTEEGQP